YARMMAGRARFRMVLVTKIPGLQGERMPTIHMRQTTTSTPEQFLTALTDFGPGRAKLFGNSADEYLKVHRRGSLDADVTEGSGGIWERLHYDRADPAPRATETTAPHLSGGHP